MEGQTEETRNITERLVCDQLTEARDQIAEACPVEAMS